MKEFFPDFTVIDGDGDLIGIFASLCFFSAGLSITMNSKTGKPKATKTDKGA